MTHPVPPPKKPSSGTLLFPVIIKAFEGRTIGSLQESNQLTPTAVPVVQMSWYPSSPALPSFPISASETGQGNHDREGFI